MHGNMNKVTCCILYQKKQLFFKINIQKTRGVFSDLHTLKSHFNTTRIGAKVVYLFYVTI